MYYDYEKKIIKKFIMPNYSDKIIYSEGLWITKNKLVKPFFFFEKINESNFNELNEINLITVTTTSIKELLHNIDLVRNSQNNNYEFKIETNLVNFTIQRDNILIKNHLFDEIEVIELTTDKFVEILNEKVKFLKRLDDEYLLSSIDYGLSNLSIHSINEISNFAEIRCLDNLLLRFEITKEEIENLDTDEFLDLLTIKLIFGLDLLGK
jgi:hypothetical protein